ncbi:StAR-related lipid transfer protein 5 [Phytophthora citrophthora]|uniref:StAR-related lipid transfer protein 5 n=1 Tax=Phytophthora citrophthora TaxID=4793 RepID=A0AAD9LRQ9_9STRA|nr:StAR-related lipid transfer protein 5 [Phytophthora citrophthora]
MARKADRQLRVEFVPRPCLAMDATGNGVALNTTIQDEEAVQTCLYCANLKVLRDLLPPKRCDYCRKWRCQFCTLKFPLLGVRKGLPKKIKGNSRICIQCFGHIWQENAAASSSLAPSRLQGDSHYTKNLSLPDRQENGRDSRGVSFVDRNSMIESRRRGSMIDSDSMGGSSCRSSMMGSSRRGSMLESERRESMMVDQVWARSGSFNDSHRLSFMDNTNGSDITKRPVPTQVHSVGISYRVASFLGLVANGGPDGTSMNAAIGLWMSLFAASILLVIALADGFSLYQRVCYCVATYGIFLMLHPWIHVNRQSENSSTKASNHTKQTVQSNIVAPQRTAQTQSKRRGTLVVPGNGPLPPAYKARLGEMQETLAYYLSEKCPWKMVKATRGSEIYEMTANQTPYAIFKIEVFITGISMANFMAFVDSKDPKDRCVWDLNEANFEVIETFDSSDLDDDVNVSVCVNTQKPFLGGLVSPRDFCLLYAARGNSICFASVEHPDVPVRPGTTRGHIFFSCFHCKEETSPEDPEGFSLTYICQTDIGGNLPVKLLYSGTMDNMHKMTKVFQQANRLFPK